MSGTVVIVIAALFGWCALSVALALVIGRRLRLDARPVGPTWIRPVQLADARQQDQRPAA
jgi:hypothetical protein